MAGWCFPHRACRCVLFYFLAVQMLQALDYLPFFEYFFIPR